MTKLVLFRLKDDPIVWVVDLTAGTVEWHDIDEIKDLVNTARGDEFEFTLVARDRAPAPQHYMFPSRRMEQ